MKRLLFFAVLSIVFCACNSTILKPGVTYYGDFEDNDMFGGYSKDTYRVEITIYEDGTVSGKFGAVQDNGELLPTDRVGCAEIEGQWSEVSKNDKKFIEIDATLGGQDVNPMYVDKDKNFYMNGINSDAIQLKKK